MIDGSTLAIILPALCAGFLVLLSHIPLGIEVVKRGIIFIDIAIAQIAGFGIILSGYIGFEDHDLEMQAIALLSAIMGAAFLGWVESRAGRYQEAIIGIVFVMAATGSILLLSKHPLGGEQLKDLLSGQILWIDWPQLVYPALAGFIVLALWYFKPQTLEKYFYYIFAIAITVSVQFVGVYLVFASLIVPALAVVKIDRPLNVFFAMLLGILAYGFGLFISAVLDLPSGAVIVWMLALAALASNFMIKKILH